MPAARVSGHALEQQYVRRSRPVVLEKLSARPINLAELRREHERLTVQVAGTRDGVLSVDSRRGVDYERALLGDFLRELSKPGSRYLITDVDRLPEPLRAVLAPPALVAGNTWIRSKLWISREGTVSPLHRDMAHNLHLQIAGKKRFVLFAPGDSRRLYPHAPWSSTPNFSHVDPERPDRAGQPLFAAAKPHVAELEPGSAILIPSRWWHHVRSLENSVSVNFWFASGALSLLVRALDLAKRLRRISR